MRETNGYYVIDYAYDAGGNLVGLKYNGVPYFYRRNLQGDVVAIVDATGALMAEYTYDAWGTVLSASGYLAGANPIRYRGYYYDSEIGSYYLQTRYYSTKWKRFWNADALFIAGNPLTASNMYAYCNGNPVMFVDPSGMAVDPFSMMWTVIFNPEFFVKLIMIAIDQYIGVLLDYGNNNNLFISLDDALLDFAMEYNPITIKEGREYATFIYEEVVNINGMDVTMYGYVKPNRGGKDWVIPPYNWFWAKKRVAFVHTHAYLPGYGNEVLSDADLRKAARYGVPMFLVSPKGIIYTHDQAGNTVTYMEHPIIPRDPRA